VAHDVSLDAGSALDEKGNGASVPNLRTARLDLDSVYGSGPDDQRFLYQRLDPRQFLLGANEKGQPDLPRNAEGHALIADTRNDQNILIAQMHLAFLRFHNQRLAQTRSFDEARRLTRWHYQWVVIDDFLTRLCGRDLVTSLLGQWGRPNLRFFRPGENASVPIEFALAGFRIGHSMVRPKYGLNDALDVKLEAPIRIFNGDMIAASLAGERSIPDGWFIQWDRFVEHDGSRPQLSKRFDTNIAWPLHLLPLPGFLVPKRAYRSLSFLTLLRGWRMSLPSGQAVARRMGESVLAGENDREDPLWWYLLREAEALGDGGERLGPVGARLVGEVLVGLLASDPTSYYRVQPDWEPTLDAEGVRFQLRDFLRHAGVRMKA